MQIYLFYWRIYEINNNIALNQFDQEKHFLMWLPIETCAKYHQHPFVKQIELWQGVNCQKAQGWANHQGLNLNGSWASLMVIILKTAEEAKKFLHYTESEKLLQMLLEYTDQQ